MAGQAVSMARPATASATRSSTEPTPQKKHRAAAARHGKPAARYKATLLVAAVNEWLCRSAMPAVALVLAREGVLVDQVHPLQTARWADDAEGAADPAVLLGTLITAAKRRPSHWRQS
ncbi:hypothetical protein ACLIYP_00455 [Streptomyces nanhaiensis]|uniref:hypothetical protein n=1 Tax=Streptomyces nanhaiensis TaxID=679319 RepID=UPI00399CFD59